MDSSPSLAVSLTSRLGSEPERKNSGQEKMRMGWERKGKETYEI